jgi:hypothetical protein
MKTVAELVVEARQKAQPVAKAEDVAFDKEHSDPVATFKAVKVDDQGVITLCGASIGKDREEDAVEKGALVGMAYDFCASPNRVFRANHDQEFPIEADLVESIIGAPVLKSGRMLLPGEEFPTDDPFAAINVEKGNETHWFVSVRPTDPAIIERARNGELVGASWGGLALKAAE